MKKALTTGLISFILLYAICILLGPVRNDIAGAIFQNLFWSLPAAVIIGLISYYGKCGKASN